MLPEEDIEIKVSNFYTKIKEPVLATVELKFTGGVTVNQVYPRDLPDLFKGETLTVFGRYTMGAGGGSGAGAVKLSGTLNGERREFVTDVKFVKDDVSRGFIPRLWATRRVGWLLDEIRMHGESAELRDEIVRLAREHGIVTPYTSYLILEDERRRRVPVSLQTMRELGDDRLATASARATYDSARLSAAVEKDGRRAVENSNNTQSLKQAEALSQTQQNYALAKSATPPEGTSGFGGGYGGGGMGGAGGGGRRAGGSAATQPAFGYRAAQNYAQQSRVVKGRAFYQNGNVWTDATAQNSPGRKQVNIAFNSDEYFDLLKKHPEATAWLSLGDEVDVVLDETLYSIRNQAGKAP